MVSTRQMATSNGGGGSGNNNNNSGSIATAASGGANGTYESARISVVTRQSSYVVTLLPVQRGANSNSNSTSSNSLTSAAVGPAPSTSTATSVATSVAAQSTIRHHHQQHHQHNLQHSNLTNGVKSSGGGYNATSAANCVVATINRGEAVKSISPVLNLLELPTEVLSQILSYAGYKKVGQMRVISHRMNSVCMHILNSTFSKLITQTYNRFHAIKGKMPRRESARRNHPLACECDIIETCYMRLSLLQMTFGKHIERGHCCFFPGAILDEVYTILNYIHNTPCLERPYRVTDELFDLSTMAMEYFRDRIESTLPDIAYFNKDFFKLPANSMRPALVVASDLSETDSLPSPPQSNMVLRKGIRKIKQGMKIYNNQLSVLRNELRTCKRKSSEQGKQIADQQKLLAEQQKQTLEYANRLDENDKKNEEMSRKFSTLLQELNKCKTELQYWRSKSPAIPTCTSCGQKVAPILPPEDYQALINQGIKPEDIILNQGDDTDAESDVSMGEQFALPDEATTAKLLALNTAAKNLKRQHNGTVSVAAVAGAIGATVHAPACNSDDGGSNHVCDQPVGDKPSEMTNVLDYAKRGNIIRTTCTSGAATSVRDSGERDRDASMISTSPEDTVASYSTALFYGAGGASGGGGNSHKGVIVSPGMLLKVATTASMGSAQLVAHGFSGVDNVAGEKSFEDVAALAAITSHETKKARRVQKATRCSGGSGKRSK